MALLMLSLTYGVRFATPKMRSVFVSFSVKSRRTSPRSRGSCSPSLPSMGLDDTASAQVTR